MQYIEGYIDQVKLGIEWEFSSFNRHDEGISIEFPVLYTNYEKRDWLKMIARALRQNEEHWLKPRTTLEDEWIIDLTFLRNRFAQIEGLNWLQGIVQIKPKWNRASKSSLSGSETEKIKFEISDLEVEKTSLIIEFRELEPSLESILADYPVSQKCGFVMMKYDDTPLQKQCYSTIEKTLEEKGLYALRADKKAYSEELLINIRTYMHHCGFGIAIFERITNQEFNPNVSLEYGYMMGLGKPVCMLKDSTLKALHTDIVGRLYHPFDIQDPETTISPVLQKWLTEKGFL